MRRLWPLVLLRLFILVAFVPTLSESLPENPSAIHKHEEPPSLWRWKFQPVSGKIDMVSPVTDAVERSIELFEHVKLDARSREPFSGQAVAYRLGRLALVFRSEGPGDPPLVWPAIEMFCQDMIDYAEKGALLQVEGLLTNNIYPDWAVFVVARIIEGGSIDNKMSVP